jgi:hypothetical protein
MNTDNEHPLFEGFANESHCWCLHCERVWPKSSWIAADWNCPGEDCDGSAIDCWRWSRFITDNDGEYPANPAPGTRYPL